MMLTGVWENPTIGLNVVIKYNYGTLGGLLVEHHRRY